MFQMDAAEKTAVENSQNPNVSDAMETPETKKVVIIGSGPTALGAIYRLTQLVESGQIQVGYNRPRRTGLD